MNGLWRRSRCVKAFVLFVGGGIEKGGKLTAMCSLCMISSRFWPCDCAQVFILGSRRRSSRVRQRLTI